MCHCGFTVSWNDERPKKYKLLSPSNGVRLLHRQVWLAIGGPRQSHQVAILSLLRFDSLKIVCGFTKSGWFNDVFSPRKQAQETNLKRAAQEKCVEAKWLASMKLEATFLAFYLGAINLPRLPHATTQPPPISRLAASEVALPKAGVDFTSFVSFSSSKHQSRLSAAICFFSGSSKEQGQQWIQKLTWQLLVDSNRKSEKTGVPFEDTVTVVWGATPDFVHQLYQISIS